MFVQVEFSTWGPKRPGWVTEAGALGTLQLAIPDVKLEAQPRFMADYGFPLLLSAKQVKQLCQILV